MEMQALSDYYIPPERPSISRHSTTLSLPSRGRRVSSVSGESVSFLSSPGFPSALLPQEVDRRRQPFSQILRQWSFEIAASAFSLGCLIAVIALAGYYNFRPTDEWSEIISLNAAVSTLITFSRSATITSVASCISQLKWHYYNKESRLHHLDDFDEASRGPWGALTFLISTKTRARWAALGAFLTVVSLAMDPFAQQVLGTGLGTILDGTDASIPLAHQYGASEDSDDLQPSMHQAILGSLLGFGNSVPVHCPAGNCVFPDFSSLGFCSTCINVTQATRVHCSNPDNVTATCTFRPPSMLNITLSPSVSVPDTTEGVPMAPVAYTYAKVVTASKSDFDSGKSTVAGWPHVLVGYSALLIGGDDGVPFYVLPTMSPWTMMECAFNFCERTYTNAHVDNFTVSQDSDPKLDKLLYSTPYYDGNYNFLSNDSKYYGTEARNQTDQSGIGDPAAPEGSNLVYGLDLGAMGSISVALENVFNVTGSDNTIGDPGQSDATSTSEYAMFANPLYSHKSDLNSFMSNISTAITNAIRTSNASTSIGGQNVQTIVLFVVSWPWLLLPILVVLVGLILLVASIVRSHRHSDRVPVWKSSSLALLLYGARLETDEMDPVESRRRWGEFTAARRSRKLKKLAHRYTARLGRGQALELVAREKASLRYDKEG